VEELLAGHPLDKTQFGAIVDKLGIGLISAHTPQAKGRIERLWGTLQDRLTVWFTLNGITTRKQANTALPAFIAEYDKAYYDRRHYPVLFQGLSNSRKTTHLPDITKLLLQKYYFADGKEPASAVA
jgi:hypothetical protein